MAITLYDHELDEDCYRLRLLAGFLGLDYTRVAVGVQPGHPVLLPAGVAADLPGRLPVLDANGLTLVGAAAGLAFLAQSHDPAQRWLPVAPDLFGPVMQWLAFSAGPLAAAVAARRSALFGLGDPQALVPAAVAALTAMEDHMVLRGHADQEWFVGDRPTLADVALFPSFALSRDFGVEHDAFPALRKWLRRFRQIEGFRVMPGIPDYA
ncbi:glutathione S-transferase family protein [Oryzibacter oryziterrae]|uniref:glutathione S-transferase family protein n=1 Tax=Oryzibacter oryziterrae TaxID=2766474 RepID=UPI0028BE9A6F|nr:glutathione binding-like protein [Oryzibacter oryziterrae]